VEVGEWRWWVWPVACLLENLWAILNKTEYRIINELRNCFV
jgi:hypothetical protein